MNNKIEELEIKRFYDERYHNNISSVGRDSKYHLRLAKKMGVQTSTSILDVACGTGGFLHACKSLGANIAGVDLSDKAISACQRSMPDGEFHSCSAESLPFPNNSFDVITCLGSLEHFVNPENALREMIRVATPGAQYLILVPNKDFLTRKLGLFQGTYQVDAKEEVRTLDGWDQLLQSAGLRVTKRWKDLHVLSWSWIFSRSWYHAPLRAAQALALTIWPLKWQYQVFHLATIKEILAD
jgi:ubiquinone/menaquinone biosynthesis C-methylase UbiE